MKCIVCKSKQTDIFYTTDKKTYWKCSEEAKIMLVEPKGVLNTGDIESELTALNDQWI